MFNERSLYHSDIDTAKLYVQFFSSLAIPIKDFVSHRPTDPFFRKVKKKKTDSLVKEASTLIYKHTILFY